MKEWRDFGTELNEIHEEWFAYCDEKGIEYKRFTPTPPPLKWRIKKWLYDTLKNIVLQIKGGIKNVITSSAEQEYYKR